VNAKMAAVEEPNVLASDAALRGDRNATQHGSSGAEASDIPQSEAPTVNLPDSPSTEVAEQDDKGVANQTPETKAPEWNFLADPACPLHWPARVKFGQVMICLFAALTA
jgi:hypothetical protein